MAVWNPLPGHVTAERMLSGHVTVQFWLCCSVVVRSRHSNIVRSRHRMTRSRHGQMIMSHHSLVNGAACARGEGARVIATTFERTDRGKLLGYAATTLKGTHSSVGDAA
eukprot:2605275-Rhodomonas_salina.1